MSGARGGPSTGTELVAPAGGADRAEAVLASLGRDERVALTTGADSWRTAAVPGVRAMVFSDGPAGVRGLALDERSTALSLPAPSCLGATWSEELAYRYGASIASEARRHVVDVVLGPMVNLHRSPLAGRHFEMLSEDPLLTAQLAAAYVRGAQDAGVGTCPKHYVGNESEQQRFTVSREIDDRALREVYLTPFEAAVRAGAWTIMAAYNAVNGTTMTESALLRSPLVEEWGFDGVVVSDWGAVRSLRAAANGTHLNMPGPDGPWGDALVDAVGTGTIPEATLDDMARRVLRLAGRVGALGEVDRDEAVLGRAARSEDRRTAYEVAVAGGVLLTNRGLLPLSAAGLRRVAVVGQGARRPRVQGAGSAAVVPECVSTPLDALRAALPGAELVVRDGVVVDGGVEQFEVGLIADPGTGSAGAHVRLLDGTGTELASELRQSTHPVWLGNFDARVRSVEVSFDYTPDRAETVSVSVVAPGHVRLEVDGHIVIDAQQPSDQNPLGAAASPGTVQEAQVDLVGGVRRRIRATVEVPASLPLRIFDLLVGLRRAHRAPDDLIREAAQAAAGCDVAVVFVSTSTGLESEGRDRTSLELPAGQDALIDAVCAANPRTVVVVMAGAPVRMPWRHRAGATLLTWFAGEEVGRAVADMLLGVAEPGGRLPTTWPAVEDDCPVLSTAPVRGVDAYGEGIHVGHRGWLRAGRTPAFPFGHGLGYTTWSYGPPRVSATSEGGVDVTLVVANTGDRVGSDVVQVYASRPGKGDEYPHRWLVGFARVRLDAGSRRAVVVTVQPRALARWDGEAGVWVTDPGDLVLHVGRSVLDVQHTVSTVLR